ncbi:esterase/lipase family protein [Pseudonocardia broussonetiae]|uniref:Lipase n=1 Tax=Pseudonocardia broussonetiae TaxID=2736640 RepID=A0A6M6JIF8_9PSEU|nr:lipase [Pseudonocardia broussonetiae]QJY47226.1 lipase [Pseudonocardia broussonetiae]
MSPRRRVLVLVVLAALLVGLVLVGVRVWPGASVDPASRPAQDVPGPVLLVPGYGGDSAALGALAARLTASGREVRVLALPGDGTGDLSAQVRVLDDAADAELAAGAPSVDVVGYSAGGVVTGLWLARDDGPAKARRVVTLGSPLHGTSLAGAGAAALPDACPPACRQVAPGSAEIAELDAARVGTLVPWLSVRTADDEVVTPVDTAVLDGATNVLVQDVCPGAVVAHGQLPSAPAVADLVLGALGPGPVAVGACVSS